MGWSLFLAFLMLFFAPDKRPKAGDPAPDFEAPATNDQLIKLSDFRGKWVVLYFYPKAFTPGCTKEACALRDAYKEIQGLGAVILGVSLDDVDILKRFKAEYQLPFELISDKDKSISRAYGVLGFGGKYAKRITFLINPEGVVAHVFKKVNAAEHDREVLEVLQKLVETSKE